MLNTKYIYSTYCMSSTVLSTRQGLTHFIFTIMLQGRYWYHSHLLRGKLRHAEANILSEVTPLVGGTTFERRADFVPSASQRTQKKEHRLLIPILQIYLVSRPRLSQEEERANASPLGHPKPALPWWLKTTRSYAHLLGHSCLGCQCSLTPAYWEEKKPQ